MSTWKRNRKNRFCLVVMTLSTRDEILLYNRKPAHYGITFMAESGVNVSPIGLYENRTFAGFTHFFRYITQYWTAEVSSNILLLVPVKFSLSTRRNSVNVELTFVSSNAAAEAFSKQFFFINLEKYILRFIGKWLFFTVLSVVFGSTMRDLASRWTKLKLEILRTSSNFILFSRGFRAENMYLISTSNILLIWKVQFFFYLTEVIPLSSFSTVKIWKVITPRNSQPEFLC